jgi:hypothetical protein
MAKSIPEGWRSVTPRLVVPYPAKLIDFLKKAFGASDFAADAPAVMTTGDSIVMLERRRISVIGCPLFFTYMLPRSMPLTSAH